MSIYGAKWWKVDFHVHTPTSICYKEDEKNTPPKDFLLNVMKKKIDCIIISDHESCGWVELLKTEYEKLQHSTPRHADFRELFIFPAFEYGQAVPSAHLLCIFDVEVKATDITKIIGELNGKSFSDCITIVTARGGIAIPAHVENTNKGILNKLESDGVLTQRLINNFFQSDLFAVECDDKNFAMPQMFIDNKICFSKVIGSDSHSLDTIGTKYTWVKMQEPNIIALRLALFDCEDGIIRYDEIDKDPNQVDNTRYIKSIEVKNARIAGNGSSLNVNFSPWLNTIIGGRGSGKSSIINFLRIGLANEEGMDKDTKIEYANFNKVPTNRDDIGMLRDNTVITTIISENNIDYKLTYTFGHGISEEILRSDGSWEITSDNIDVIATHPVAIFNQKQVYNLANSQNAVMQIIDGMCGIAVIRAEIKKSIDNYVELCRQIRKLKETVNEEPELLRTSKVNRAKLEVARSSSINTLLEKLQFAMKFDGVINNVTSMISEKSQIVQETVDKLSELAFSTFPETDNLDEEYKGSAEQVEEFKREYIIETEKIFAQAKELLAKNDVWVELTKQLPFVAYFQKLKLEIEQEKAKLQEQGIIIGEIQTVLNSNEQIQEDLIKIDKTKVQIKELFLEQEQAKEAINSLILSINGIRKTKLDEINANNQHLRIELVEYGSAEGSEKDFRKAINKDDATFSQEIYEVFDNGSKQGILNDICSLATVDARLRKRKAFISDIINYCESEKYFDFNGKFKAYCKKTFESNPELFDKLIFWYPSDDLRLILKTNDSEIPVSSGSAGQKVAGMLALLLTISDKPIIIDQPEEDLDTQLISSFVVEKFKSLKTTQQLIVVTHNPNIPVNAAAENIVSMAFSAGQIRNKNSGALQIEEIRKDICIVMEGGKKALDNRYFRVSKALKNE